jgi:NADP-dependent 3-hydroxy acid dehydrogenase YdfG
VSKLSNKYESNNIFSFQCDVQELAQVQALWDEAKRQFGTIDIWINNAGVAHPQMNVRDYSTEQIKGVIDTNIKGTINGSIVTLNGMQEQGFGSIYNMEGLGSDGRVISGMALYGLSKSAVGYFTKAMAKETQGTPLIVGGLSPGMVATKLITSQYAGKPEEWERVKRLFSILSDRVETVAPWLARKILANNKNTANISWLTRRKVMTRFLLSPFVKRNIFDD